MILQEEDPNYPWWGEMGKMLTPNLCGSYPPDIWTAVAATNSGLMFGSIVSFKAYGDVSKPLKMGFLM